MSTYVSKVPALSVDALIEAITIKIAIENSQLETLGEFRKKVEEERLATTNTAIGVQ